MACMKETRITYSKDRGIHLTIIREIQIGTIVRHPNLLPIINYAVQSDGICQIIMPLISHDLPGLIRQWRLRAHTWHSLRTLPWVKCIFIQLLTGLSYLHRNSVMHRDIKLNNILIRSDGVAMLCDYGWSRILSCNPGKHTYPPFTIVYRSIELLLGFKAYSVEADIWAMGCLLVEMLCYKPLFHSESSLESIQLIFQAIGPLPDKFKISSKMSAIKGNPLTPEQRVTSMKLYLEKKMQFKDLIEDEFISFLLKMICYDPSSRYTAEQLLNDPWLQGHASGVSGAIKPSTITSFSDILPSNNTYRLVDKAHELGMINDLEVNNLV